MSVSAALPVLSALSSGFGRVMELDKHTGLCENRQILTITEGRVEVRPNIDGTASSPRGGVWYKAMGQGCKAPRLSGSELQPKSTFQCTRPVS